MFQTIQGSAHDIKQVADKSVQLIATSPPYLGLRSYDGEQAIEWPTVEYAPMPGLPPIRVQGCEPGCVHEWTDGPILKSSAQQDNGPAGGVWNAQSRGTEPSAKRTQFTATQGTYCIHCGGWRGGLGLEPDPFAYVGHLILCLREWRRVLRDDGLCFVNLGDSYSGSGAGGGGNRKGNEHGQHDTMAQIGRPKPAPGLKPKDLMQIPQRFALAAQADGWYLRSAIVWAKGLSFLPDYAGSCMPESVTDRPTQSYEMVYMLAKSERYFCDMEAVKEAVIPHSLARYRREKENGLISDAEHKYAFKPTVGKGVRGQQGVRDYVESGRNLRNVWAISPTGFSAAHFACWPERLVEPLIKMGTSARGCCPACGAPWRRVVERKKVGQLRPMSQTNGVHPQANYDIGKDDRTVSDTSTLNHVFDNVTTGWEPTCTCDAGEPTSCTVLDPFSGSGTTGKVAVRLGRRYIGVDLSEKYLTEITEARMGAGVQMELTW